MRRRDPLGSSCCSWLADPKDASPFPRDPYRANGGIRQAEGSTRASGQHRVVTFRWACDKKLREALVDFAQDTVRASPWAEQLYRRHRQQRKTHPHAARILTRAWISVLWRCWQDRQPYDPARHRALQRVIAPGG